jgi:hypothetical protein
MKGKPVWSPWGQKGSAQGHCSCGKRNVFGRVKCYSDCEGPRFASGRSPQPSGDTLGGEVGVEALLAGVKTEWVVSRGRS